MTNVAVNRVHNARTGATLGEKIEAADTWVSRLVGLLGTRALAPTHGLWLKPCGGVHTLGMRYPIDVVFLDKESRVKKVASRLRPYRFCLARPGVSSALELPAGTLDEVDVQLGDSLVFEPVSAHPVERRQKEQEYV